MSYSVQPPPVAAPPLPVASPAGRPPVVTAAAVLLWVMGTAGLVYAISTLVIVPGTVDRFQDVATGDEPEMYVGVVWLGAAVALALAVILFALYVVLGIALRRGSNAARVTTLVVSGLGVLTGAGTALIVAAERSGDAVPGTTGAQLSDAYPGGWISTNAGLAVAQVLGYAVVAALVLAAPRAFFRGAAPAAGPQAPSFNAQASPGEPTYPPLSGVPYSGPAGGAPDAGPAYGAPYGGPAYGAPYGGPAHGAPYGGPAYGAPYGGPPHGSPPGAGYPGQPYSAAPGAGYPGHAYGPPSGAGYPGQAYGPAPGAGHPVPGFPPQPGPGYGPQGHPGPGFAPPPAWGVGTPGHPAADSAVMSPYARPASQPAAGDESSAEVTSSPSASAESSPAAAMDANPLSNPASPAATVEPAAVEAAEPSPRPPARPDDEFWSRPSE